MKSQCRKQITEERRQRTLTGGGPGPQFIDEDVMMSVVSIAPHLDVELTNCYDSQHGRTNADTDTSSAATIIDNGM